MGDFLYWLFIIAAFAGGVIIGTQLAWYFQILILFLSWRLVDHMAPGDLSALVFVIPYIIFVVGVIIGNINWLIQTGGEGAVFGSFFDMFIAK